MEMQIGVIADTHIPRRAVMIPNVVKEKFNGVNLIIHAGDLVDLKVIKELEEIAPVEAVYGNIDPVNVRDRLPRKRIVNMGGFNIGIYHGDGVSGNTLNRAQKAFSGHKTDCIVFGHSHIPVSEWIDGILMFNPGSPTDRRRQPYHSFGILTLTQETIDGRLYYFKDETLLN